MCSCMLLIDSLSHDQTWQTRRCYRQWGHRIDVVFRSFTLIYCKHTVSLPCSEVSELVCRRGAFQSQWDFKPCNLKFGETEADRPVPHQEQHGQPWRLSTSSCFSCAWCKQQGNWLVPLRWCNEVLQHMHLSLGLKPPTGLTSWNSTETLKWLMMVEKTRTQKGWPFAEQFFILMRFGIWKFI